MNQKRLGRELSEQTNEEQLAEDSPESNSMMSESERGGWHTDICRGIVMAYFLVMVLIYPFYAPGGYTLIGDVKYEFFRNISLTTIAVMAVVIVAAVLCRRDGHWLVKHYQTMSVTDWFAYGYFVAVMLSYLGSAYKEDALWGVEGWYMGTVTQMIFVLLYFFFSRYFYHSRGWIEVWLAASAVVFLLGICNRYSVYPIVMDGQTDTFISTLGNINWFCGYWSVAASIGITWYWCSVSGWARLPAGIYSMIAMLSGITQGSDSAYLVFAAIFIVLFLLSFHNGHKMYRFLELCMMFAVSCRLGRVLRYVPALDYNYGPADGGSRITAALLDSNVALWGLAVLILCYGLLRGLDRSSNMITGSRADSSACTGIRWWLRGSYMRRHKRRCVATVGASVVLFCVVIAYLFQNGVLYVRGASEAAEEESGFLLIFNDDWGNGRGAAWNCGIDAYRNMDILHKLVGIGPDCFADYVYDVPKLAQKLADSFTNQRLTNAHNELLTQLVNVGVLGFLCYMGLFLSAFLRCMGRADKQPVLYMCAVGILAYAAHGMVSFQQVLNTPYIFIVMGIGERLCRSMDRRTEDRITETWEK
ncbi:MAG: O-antigen ligase family protein [Lachnospiraceae bacterium]|nr:O-antigen ligase family protein [Lachnospiraceae bacterium]